MAHKLLKKGGGFSRFAKATAFFSGTPTAFGIATALIFVWGLSGPLFHFSDTWQLVINTSTTIVTFLMVFLIQNTQNRDSQAIHLKLDELIRASKRAHTALMDVEELSDGEICRIKEAYLGLAKKGREEIRKGVADTGTPEVTTETFCQRPDED